MDPLMLSIVAIAATVGSVANAVLAWRRRRPDAKKAVAVTITTSDGRSINVTASQLDSPAELAKILSALGDRSAGREAGVAHEGQIVMPFYVICDVSGSMSGDMDALNEGLEQLRRVLIADPIVDDLVRLSVITFDDQARTVVPLAPPTEVVLPRLSAGGGTVYSSAFREFHHAFEADRHRLRGEGKKVFRPCVFFLTDGEPSDKDFLQTFQSLLGYDPTTKQGNATYPYVTTFGFRDANQTTLASIAYPNFGETSKRGRWFVARYGTTVDQLLRSMTAVIGSSVLQSRSRSIAIGVPAYVAPTSVEGMDGNVA